MKGSNPGTHVTYRTVGGTFNTERIKANTTVTKSLVPDILCPYDCAIVANSDDDFQRLTDPLFGATKCFGWTISIKKNKMVFQPAKESVANMPEIKFDGEVLNNIDSLSCLDSSLSSSNSFDMELFNHIAEASGYCDRLHKRV